jgi:hypothetical protein
MNAEQSEREKTFILILSGCNMHIIVYLFFRSLTFSTLWFHVCDKLRGDGSLAWHVRSYDRRFRSCYHTRLVRP